MNKECEESLEELRKINRALSMHKDCIQEVMRAGSEEELLDSVRRVMAERGGYRRVFFLPFRFHLSIEPEADYACETLRKPFEAGTGAAVTARKIEECDRCSFRPNPEERCHILAVPIKVRGKCEYILVACGDPEKGGFVHEEIALMEELARDLSFGIEVLRVKKEREEALESLKYAAFHDSLTGLYNRAFFMEELHRLDVKRGLPLSIIFVDMDGLKLINDTFGHLEGDRLLVRLAQVLKGCLREEDIVSRLGGDEFAVLLPKTDHKTAQDIARRIEEALKGLSAGPIAVSASMGVATKDDPLQDIEAVFSEAEKKMYRAKVKNSASIKGAVLDSLYNWRRSTAGYNPDNARLLLAISQKVGAAMDLSAAELERLYFLALFHDIGFIAMPEGMESEDIEELSGEELRHYAEHVEVGYRIASSVPELAPIAKEILLHHERWDGKGFPQSLAGEEIPLLARILAPVHAYCDALFVKGLSEEEAISAVIKKKGKAFDPHVVDVLVKVLSEGAKESGAIKGDNSSTFLPQRG